MQMTNRQPEDFWGSMENVSEENAPLGTGLVVQLGFTDLCDVSGCISCFQEC